MASLIAAPPSVGVRVCNAAASATSIGDTVIEIIDGGARGYPEFMALVAAERKGDRYCRVGQSRGVGDSIHWVVNDDPMPPYALTVPRVGTEALVVLLYYDKIDQGQAASFALDKAKARDAVLAGAQSPTGVGGPTAPGAELVAAAIDALLANEPADRLDRARVSFPPKTREPTSEVAFVLASCQYPCDILDHMPAGPGETAGPADASLLKVAELFDGAGCGPRPTLLLMAGDQVYVDATAGLFDPKAQDDRYRLPYYTFFASRGPQAVLSRAGVDVRMMLDDHEIADNWEPGDEPDFGKPDSQLTRGVTAFRRFERDDRAEKAAPAHAQLDQSFEHRGLHFFLANTRTEREARTARDFADKLIMKEAQFNRLKKWMSEHLEAPKFVLTPSILLPRRLATKCDPLSGLHSDAWDGYPRSLHALLEWVCDHRVRHLVFLSGDEHLGCDAAILLKRNDDAAVSIRSLHCPALYAPYPFANSIAEDFAACDLFEWLGASGATYRCAVRASFPAERRNGFVLVTTDPTNPGALRVEFPPIDAAQRTASLAGEPQPPG